MADTPATVCACSDHIFHRFIGFSCIGQCAGIVYVARRIFHLPIRNHRRMVHTHKRLYSRNQII